MSVNILLIDSEALFKNSTWQTHAHTSPDTEAGICRSCCCLIMSWENLDCCSPLLQSHLLRYSWANHFSLFHWCSAANCGGTVPDVPQLFYRCPVVFVNVQPKFLNVVCLILTQLQIPRRVRDCPGRQTDGQIERRLSSVSSVHRQIQQQKTGQATDSVQRSEVKCKWDCVYQPLLLSLSLSLSLSHSLSLHLRRKWAWCLAACYSALMYVHVCVCGVWTSKGSQILYWDTMVAGPRPEFLSVTLFLSICCPLFSDSAAATLYHLCFR